MIFSNLISLASSNLPNLIDSTYKQHQEINERLAFSLCFGYDGGYMTIGGYNSEKHLPNATVNIVPYKGRGGQYVVNIYKAKVSHIIFLFFLLYNFKTNF